MRRVRRDGDRGRYPLPLFLEFGCFPSDRIVKGRLKFGSLIDIHTGTHLKNRRDSDRSGYFTFITTVNRVT